MGASVSDKDSLVGGLGLKGYGWDDCYLSNALAAFDRLWNHVCQSVSLPVDRTSWTSVLFFSRPRSEGWPNHVRTFCIYLCPVSFCTIDAWSYNYLPDALAALDR